MFNVGLPLRATLIGALLAMAGPACSKRDLVIGARGGSLAGASADTAGRSGDAGSMSMTEVSDAGGQTSASRPSLGCGSDPPLPPEGSIEVNGALTHYVVDLPAAYDKTRAYPLVMAFRRSDTTVEAFRESLGLPVVAGSDGVLVHPNCPNDATTWDVPGDLPMIDALLAKLASSYCIDQDRVFAVGLGQGALLVNAFGCARNGVLRGLAPLSAVLAPPAVCAGRAAVWLMQGSAEPSTMTYGHENRDFWLERNGCDASMPMAVPPSPCVAYAGCDPGLPVRFCEYGPELELPSFTAGAIWDFFREL